MFILVTSHFNSCFSHIGGIGFILSPTTTTTTTAATASAAGTTLPYVDCVHAPAKLDSLFFWPALWCTVLAANDWRMLVCVFFIKSVATWCLSAPVPIRPAIRNTCALIFYGTAHPQQ